MHIDTIQNVKIHLAWVVDKTHIQDMNELFAPMALDVPNYTDVDRFIVAVGTLLLEKPGDDE